MQTMVVIEILLPDMGGFRHFRWWRICFVYHFAEFWDYSVRTRDSLTL